MQAVAYANRAFRRYLQRGEFDQMVAAAETRARAEGKQGTALEARTHARLLQDPRFLEVVAEAKSLVAAKDEALAAATGRAPLFQRGDPHVNKEHATGYRERAQQITQRTRLARAADLAPGVMREIVANRDRQDADELLKLAAEQHAEARYTVYSLDSGVCSLIAHEMEREDFGDLPKRHQRAGLSRGVRA